MKNCAECQKPAEATFRSGLVPKEVCESCYNRLVAEATQEACNPPGDKSPLEKVGVTTETVEAAVKENLS